MSSAMEQCSPAWVVEHYTLRLLIHGSNHIGSENISRRALEEMGKEKLQSFM